MDAVKYKVWIHIEGTDKDGDCVEGDEFFEPEEVGCFSSARKAENFRDELADVANALFCKPPQQKEPK